MSISELDVLSPEIALERVLKLVEPQEGLVVLEEEERALARFSDNSIRQNLLRRDRTLVLQLRFRDRMGVGVSHSLENGALEELVRETRRRADKLPQDQDMPPLARPEPHVELNGFSSATSKAPARERVGKIEEAVEILKEKNLSASGFLETITHRLWVTNSEGVNKFFEETLSTFRVIAKSDKGSTGFAQTRTRSLKDIHPERVAERALEKALWGRKATLLPSGKYTVILEPEPLAHLLLFLGFLGLGGKTLVSGMSFMRGKMGEMIVGENVTLIDDATDPRTLGVPFDYEGVPKRRVVLIEKGVARGVVTDMRTAKKLGTESTGHALRPDNSYGPYPKNLILEPGQSEPKEMIRGVERGVLISRFWYVNFVNPMLTQVTGTTRDGTLLVEKGEITEGVKDMRFLVSILDILKRIAVLAKEQQLTYRYGAHLLVPSVLVEDFPLILEGSK